MLDKPRVLWVLLAAASGVVLAALALVTQQALRSERGEGVAQAAARFEESIRTALWRLDSEMTPILAREAGRPYYEYRSFIPTDVLTQRGSSTPDDRTLLVPSPLLETRDQLIRLHFEQRGGRITSPELPQGQERGRAQDTYTSSYDLAAAEESLRFVRTLLSAQAQRPAPATSEQENIPPGVALEDTANAATPTDGAPEVSEQADKSKNDYLQRQDILQKAQSRTMASNNASTQRGAASPAPAIQAAADKHRRPAESGEQEANFSESRVRLNEARVAEPLASFGRASLASVVHGKLTPEWFTVAGAPHPTLMYTRTIVIDGEEIRQGFWIDWPGLRAGLLEAIGDLFPQAKLTPVTTVVNAQTPPQVLSRMMATVPAMLEVPTSKAPGPHPWSPVRSILLASWLVVLLALGGLALIVRAAGELAARRGKFVSAVSHELRTPLTTFSMYSQMLAEGMVEGEEAQRAYACTLHEQSGRLSRIVESVLDFARLGRDEPVPVREVPLSELADRVEGIAQELCTKAGRTLARDDAGTQNVRVRTDPAVVERIVANLVENACKYGDGAITMRWSISEGEPGAAQLLIFDEGPGVPERESRRIFRAFERGSAHAHGSTPGLGLGLAVSRELARRAGGDLRHFGGSRFALTVPTGSG